jgi:dolichol-phosphate mannosyltransferase
VRDAIIAPQTTYPFLRAELGYVGFVRVGLPYARGRRTIGRTHYNVFRMARFAVSGFLAGSTFPLRFILYLATLAAIAFPIAALLVGGGPAGVTSVATVTILYFLLVSVPTIALYLARTYKNGVARPVFIVDRSRTHL